MARIRTIKPEFFTSEDIVCLTPHARLLYVALWCEADREGRLAWRPLTFKMRYLPADTCDMQAMCAELISAGLVCLYGDGLAHIPQFLRHQHINPREAKSELPSPSDTQKQATRAPRVDDASTTRAPRAAERVSTVTDAQVGKERKGKEDASTTRTPGARFDEFWSAWPTGGRKAAQEQCRQKWITKGCDGIADQILRSLEAHKRSRDWTKDGGTYIPAPLVWINQSRWEGEVYTGPSGDAFAGVI